MAEIKISKIKDLATMDTIATGAGVATSIVAGEFVSGALGGVFVVPETDILKTAGVKALGKLILGGVGAVVATQKGTVGKFGVGMAVGGIGGAIADMVIGGIQTTAPASTGATMYRLGRGMVRPMRALPFRGALSTGRTAFTPITSIQDVTSGLEILPRD